MKKKMLTSILAITVALSLSACGESSSSGKDSDTTPPPSASQANTDGNSEPGQGNPSTAEGSGDLGDYHVEIKNASIVKDYEDKPAILVTYAWTNNSEDTTSAMVALIGKAFQDGIELDTAILTNVDGYEAGTSMKEIRPGATLDVQAAYVLTSETSVVEFELSELISLSDDVVSMNFDPTAI